MVMPSHAYTLIESCLPALQDTHFSAVSVDGNKTWQVRMALHKIPTAEPVQLPCKPEDLAEALTLITNETFHTGRIPSLAIGKFNGEAVICTCPSHEAAGRLMEDLSNKGFNIHASTWKLFDHFKGLEPDSPSPGHGGSPPPTAPFGCR